ncbi:MAG: deoxyhypusine synthase family protein [Candidatus Omnitrophota bacterium]|nr:deoxyhypusine synthase family protein [Candidatus Omnitrophota bacterium]
MSPQAPSPTKEKTVRQFIEQNYRHFNSAVVVDAARAYETHINAGNKMMITLGGAMSTAELGISLAEMIRQDKVHAVCSTGANLEEDIFNLVAHSHYERVPGYRDLTPEDEIKLRDSGRNRVTDTCIPEEEAMRRIERKILELWSKAADGGLRFFPYEFIYQLIRSGTLKEHYEIDPKDSWVVAACEKGIPIFTPGWEDSTLGNCFVAGVIKGTIKTYDCVKSGLEQMGYLVDWYKQKSMANSIGFFQIGGGISGDFPICVVPLIIQDLKHKDCKLWSYFCQISDSTTSYGSYSGAVPNEKITWHKLDASTPRFVIESDATIVAPLIFAYVLNK